MITLIFTPLLGAAIPIPLMYYVAAQAGKTAGEHKLWDARWIRITAALAISLFGGFAAYRLASTAVPALSQLKLAAAFLVALAAAIYDARLRIIPNILPLILIVTRLILFFIEYYSGSAPLMSLVSSSAALLTAGLTLMIAEKLSKGGVGYGDIKLVAALGFMCGFNAIIIIVTLALVSCTLVALPLLISKRKDMSGSLPFAPFLMAGLTAAILLSLY